MGLSSSRPGLPGVFRTGNTPVRRLLLPRSRSGPSRRRDHGFNGTGRAFPCSSHFGRGGVWTSNAPRTALPGLRPFGRYVRAGRERARDPVPLTLDDGTDFTNWHDHAFYGPNGEPLAVTSDWGSAGVLLRTLGAVARRWAQPSPRNVSPIVVDPDLVRRVGGPGPVLEALRADLEADADEHRVVVTEEDATAIVRGVAKKLGPRAFSRLAKIPYQDVCELVVGGRKTRRSTVRRALVGVRSAQVPRCRRDGCDEAITRSRQLYCSPACREAARRTRPSRRRGETMTSRLRRALVYLAHPAATYDTPQERSCLALLGERLPSVQAEMLR